MLTKLYWIDLEVEGRLAMMPRPRGGDWLEDEVKELEREGVDVVVSLLEPAEVRELELETEQAVCESEGIEFISHPVRDRDVPASQESFRALAARLVEKLRQGRSVVVHCRGGIGRAGLLAGAVMVLLGIGADESMERLTAARGRPVPETEDQREWLLVVAGDRG